MEDRLSWDGSQRVTSGQKLCYLPKAMFSVQNKMAATHSAPPRTFSSLAWGGGFPVYQQGTTIPYGVSVFANSANPYIIRRTPLTSGPTFRWQRSNRGLASFATALKTPLPAALRAPVALNLPRRFSDHRAPAFVSGGSAVHEKVSFVESASYSSLLPERAQQPVLATEVPETYNYRQWHLDTGYIHGQAQPGPSYDATPVQFGGVVDTGAQVYDGVAETPAASDGYYASHEVPNGWLAAVAADDADTEGPSTGPEENACDAGDDDRGELDDSFMSCSEDEDETGDIGDGDGSDEKTREAVANLLTVMAEERRNRRWRRLANRRASGRRPTGTGSMNETVRKLISFTRMRCPYQEPVRACETIQPPSRACMSVKSLFWASDDYIQETTYAVKVLLEKY